MEQFQKALQVFLEMDEQLLKEIENIDFQEELKTNFVAQTCLFLLTRKEYQKRELLLEYSVAAPRN